jgi:hypothetical protein
MRYDGVMALSTKDVQNRLRTLGFPLVADGSYGPITHQAVSDFQRGFAYYNLLIDGYAGPQTWAALDYAVGHNGHASPHFKFSEFKSHGNGWIKVNRVLIHGLEVYRQRYGPTSIVSGYRDPLYNQKIGGAKSSQHMYGNASDLRPIASINAVRNLKVFSGIGYEHATGLVAHVDVRHDGPRTTPGTPTNPTIWVYY